MVLYRFLKQVYDNFIVRQNHRTLKMSCLFEIRLIAMKDSRLQKKPPAAKLQEGLL